VDRRVFVLRHQTASGGIMVCHCPTTLAVHAFIVTNAGGKSRT